MHFVAPCVSSQLTSLLTIGVAKPRENLQETHENLPHRIVLLSSVNLRMLLNNKEELSDSVRILVWVQLRLLRTYLDFNPQ